MLSNDKQRRRPLVAAARDADDAAQAAASTAAVGMVVAAPGCAPSMQQVGQAASHGSPRLLKPRSYPQRGRNNPLSLLRRGGRCAASCAGPSPAANLVSLDWKAHFTSNHKPKPAAAPIKNESSKTCVVKPKTIMIINNIPMSPFTFSPLSLWKAPTRQSRQQRRLMRYQTKPNLAMRQSQQPAKGALA